MTRRPVQQARRASDRQYLGTWPERERYDWSPIRARPVDLIGLAVGTIVMSAVLVALVLALIVMSGLS